MKCLMHLFLQAAEKLRWLNLASQLRPVSAGQIKHYGKG